MKPAMKRLKASFPFLLSFMGLALVVSGAIGLALVQKPLEEPQIYFSEAAVQDGTARVVSLTSTSQDIKPLNEPANIALGFNTANTPVNRFSVVFNVITEAVDALEIAPAEISGVVSSTELQVVEDGFLVEVTLLPENGTYFISNFDQLFLDINFTPDETGELELNFDAEESVAITANTGEDILRFIPTLSYMISDADQPGSCNENCGSNADCGNGLRCYDIGGDSRCRLVVNPTSSSCTATDDSEKSQCSGSCETDRDCASGLSCYQSLCRNPRNLSSASCSNPQNSSSENDGGNNSEISSCNEACSAHSDCDVNYSCYQGACRLAANPSSTSCSASTENTISGRYSNNTATASAETNDSKATASAAINEIADNIDPTPTPISTPKPKQGNPVAALRKVDNFSDTKLPLLVAAAGGVLLFAGIGTIAFNKLRRKKPKMKALNQEKDSAYKPKPAVAPAAPSSPPPSPAQAITSTSTMMERLKNKGVKAPKTAANTSAKAESEH